MLEQVWRCTDFYLVCTHTHTYKNGIIFLIWLFELHLLNSFFQITVKISEFTLILHNYTAKDYLKYFLILNLLMSIIFQNLWANGNMHQHVLGINALYKFKQYKVLSCALISNLHFPPLCWKETFRFLVLNGLDMENIYANTYCHILNSENC